MKKNLLLFIFATLVICSAKAQGIYNNGAVLIIPSGIYLSIDGSGGHYTNTSGGQIELGGTLDLKGNWTNNSGSVFSGSPLTDGIIVFSGSNTQDIGGSATTIFENLNVNKSGGVLGISATAMNIAGNLNVIAGNFDANNQNITVSGNWSNNGTFTADNSSVSFTGTALQSINPGTGSFYNVSFNNTSAGNSNISIAQPMIINGAATFTDGIINFSGSGSLTFGNTGSSNGGAAGSFVNGTVSKTGTSVFTFPTGEVSGSNPVWAPIAIAAPAAASTITADYNFSNPGNNWDSWYMCDFSQLDHTSGVEHWSLTSTSATPAVTLYWKNSVRSGILNISDIIIAQWEDCSGTPKWVHKGGTATDDGGGAGHVSSSIPFTAYSTKITFGTKKNTNPLPVDLITFTADCENDGVLLKWSTATETNNDYFTLEKSSNASDWYEIAKVPGAGNSNQLMHYAFTDRSLQFGTVYYRLKQTDFDGSTDVFSPIDIKCADENDMNVTIYPNPFKQEIYIAVDNYLSADAEIGVYDMIGNKITSQTFDYIDNHRMYASFDLSKLACGMYFVEVGSDGFSKKFKIIKN